MKGGGTEPVQGVDALTQACGAAPAGPFHGDNLGTLAPGEVTFNSAGPATIGTSGVLFGPDFQQTNPAAAAPNSCKTVGPGDSPGGAIYKLPAAPAGGYTLLGATLAARDRYCRAGLPALPQRVGVRGGPRGEA